jgi:monoamine oxidase
MIQRLSRRRFLQAGALASAAFAAPRMARAQDADIFDDGNRDVPGGVEGDPDRVLVIGAGFAGLTAANALARAGVDVVVLEGRERLGGRTFTKDVGGVAIDMGASWIHNPVGNPMSRYAALTGVGQRNAAITNDLLTFTAYDATSGLLTGPEVVNAFLQTSLFDRETAPLLEALGSRATIEQAIQVYIAGAGLDPATARRGATAIRFLSEQDASGASNDIGLEGYLHGPFRAYEGNDTGNFPDGGYRRLVRAMASGLDVRLGQRVTRIEVGGSGVVVHAKSKKGGRSRRRRFRGSHVVVAVPLGVLKRRRIAFEPFLPIPKVRSIERLGFGFFEKVALRFKEPFWQAGGRTHLLYLSASGALEFPLFVDLQHIQGDPALVCLTSGTFARSLGQMRRSDIRARVLEILREVYGPTLPPLTDAFVTRWGTDPFTDGAYSFLPVGADGSDMDRLAEPVGGRLLFAGEATYGRRHATADGALSSGVREAKRLLGQASVRLSAPSRTAALSVEDWPRAALSMVDRLRRRVA